MRFITFILIIVFSTSGFSQTEFLEKKGRTYIYEGKAYKCKELGAVYSTYQESLDLYNSGRRQKRVARNMGYIGLGILGGGIGAGLIVGDVEGAVVAGLSIATTIVVELIALAPRRIGNSRLKRARKEFNYEMVRRHGYKEDTSLSLSVTNNGLGMVISF